MMNALFMDWIHRSLPNHPIASSEKHESNYGAIQIVQVDCCHLLWSFEKVTWADGEFYIDDVRCE